jgi:TetR/AcrR family transcriptional regulator, transcriptional repressor for nem operon
LGIKGSKTRQQIIEEALQLFSVKGYFNTSISDILEATHLTKGGLYGHFRSKEEIWYAVYEEAAKIWKSIVFKDISKIPDPLQRIEKSIENALKNYLGAHVFDGGCFFANMLVELSGQSVSMNKQILRGYVRFAKLLRNWLEEADRQGLVKKGLDFKEIANFIVISINGAVTLYSSNRDPHIWKQTITQLRFFINQLKK